MRRLPLRLRRAAGTSLLLASLTACGAPEGQRPQFTTEKIATDPCAGATTGAVAEPLTAAANDHVRGAVADATWLMYARVAEMEPGAGGAWTLALEPIRIFEGPCTPERLVAIRTSVERPLSAGTFAMLLLDDGHPPHVVGEPDALRVREVEQAYGVVLVTGQVAVLPEGLPLPTTTVAAGSAP